MAFTDTTYPISLNGEVYSRTVLTTSCEILVHGAKCETCQNYRSALQVKQVKTKRNEVERLKLRLKEATEKRRICVEKQLEDDLQAIMLEKTEKISQKYAKNSFHRLFWDQQLEAFKV